VKLHHNKEKMKKSNLFVLYTLLFVTVAFSKAGAQQVFKTTSPSTIGYLEYLPSNYNSNSNKYPIVIFLHGIGERGPNTTDKAILEDNIYKVAKLGPPMYVKNGTQFPFILISPQLKSNYGTWPSSYVMEVINHVKKYLRVDERRIYITGLSLGGGGTWVTVQDNAKLFAAVAPVCGGYNSPSKAINIAKENLPVWAFHGDKDTVVPMSKTVNMINAINGCTPKPSPLAKLTIYAGVGHSAWNYAYRTDHSMHTPNVYEWMLSYTNTSTAGNKIPIANAGADKSKSISTGSSIYIYGSATDSDGTIASYTWTKISGPTGTLSGTTTKTLKVSSLKKGTYIFRLQAKDNSGNTESDYVKLTVND
jgi:dienelactone hydrolase